jgi:hypothetical protein
MPYTQIITYSGSEYNGSDPHSCHRCGSADIKIGAGLKPGQVSQKCGDCGEFLGYSPVARLKRAKKRKNLTESLNLLESCGIRSEQLQLFVLSAIGGQS